MSGLILPFLALALLAAPGQAADKKLSDESVKKIKELQKERIATLKDLVEGTGKLFQSARVEYQEPLAAIMSLLQAELEATEKESDRIAIYKQTIDLLTTYEKVAKAQYENGRATKMAGFAIKAKRLEVEILLEKAKAVKEGK
jgi:hypothetical protein